MGARDHRSAGRSELVPFVPGESAEDRHRRRLETNIADGRAAVEAWCAGNGVTLRIANEGHHWQFRRKVDGWRADWWPSSAKLVVMQRFDRGVHVHDWNQAIAELTKALARHRAPPAKKARRR